MAWVLDCTVLTIDDWLLLCKIHDAEYLLKKEQIAEGKYVDTDFGMTNSMVLERINFEYSRHKKQTSSS